MPVPTPVDLNVVPFRFDDLGGGTPLRSIYTVGWRLSDVPEDAWSARFISAKDGVPPEVLGAKAVCRRVFQPRNRDAIRNGIVVIPAIGSDRELAQQGDLPYELATAIAEALGGELRADILMHRPRAALRGLGSAAQREAAVRNAYYLRDDAEPLDNRIAFIVDDFLTAGSTIRAIARTLADVPGGVGNIYGACLAKNERRSSAVDYGGFVPSNDHIPVEYAQVWDQAQGR